MPREEFNSDSIEFAKRLDRGEKIAPLKGDYFESLEAVRAVLTEKRLELWRLIRDQQPNSISGLAELAHRDFKSVHTDVSVLIDAGLVELRKARGIKTRARKPVSLVDQLRFDVA